MISTSSHSLASPSILSPHYNGDFIATISEKDSKSVSHHEFEILSNEVQHSHNAELHYNHDVKINFPDFNCDFNFEIVDINWSLNSDKISFYLNLDEKLLIKATLEGSWEQAEEPKFQLKSFGLKLEKKQETPISIFLASTLWAILGLTSNFRILIPQLNYDFSASFELPLKQISNFLQERQIAYRLLIIEKALGIQLQFPNGDIDGKDIENISFCYRAIVEREFDWFSFPTTIPWIANQESLSWLPKKDEPTPITFRPEFLTKFIFGAKVPIGILTVKVEKAAIDNYKEVKEKLAKLDGNIVDVKFRSLNGISRIIALDVPELQKKLWSDDLQKLIDLDEKFNSIFMNKYFDLASATLDGLTQEQIEAITQRPHLDEEAFDF